MAGSLKNLCAFMRMACEDWSLGYDQDNRWDIRDGGECDCSSLAIHALQVAGFDTGNASYTGNMSDNLTARGWKRLPADISTAQPGDILLNDTHHVCVVIAGNGWNATIAQASIDERGRATGGASGDQGNETNTRNIYEYRYGWDCILRWGGGSDADGGGDGSLDVDGWIGPLTITKWQQQCGTPVDGEISGQGENYSKWFPRITSITWEADGSALMEAVQAKIGVPNPTGVAARGTICMLQGWLVLKGYDIGNDTAGVLDEGTAMALQRSLNAGAWA